MRSAERDPRQPRPGEYLAPLAFVTSLALLLLLAGGCSPRIYERVITQRDTTYIVKRDSVKFYDRDSIFVREKGDTIYKYVEKWKYRDRVRVDTILQVRVDSVAVERIKEVKIEKPLSWWQSFKIGAFWWLCGAVALLLLWTFRKLIFKL